MDMLDFPIYADQDRDNKIRLLVERSLQFVIEGIGRTRLRAVILMDSLFALSTGLSHHEAGNRSANGAAVPFQDAAGTLLVVTTMKNFLGLWLSRS